LRLVVKKASLSFLSFIDPSMAADDGSSGRASWRSAAEPLLFIEHLVKVVSEN
jgi:hypothetical protein